jgi:hypothetical protein
VICIENGLELLPCIIYFISYNVKLISSKNKKCEVF